MEGEEEKDKSQIKDKTSSLALHANDLDLRQLLEETDSLALMRKRTNSGTSLKKEEPSNGNKGCILF